MMVELAHSVEDDILSSGIFGWRYFVRCVVIYWEDQVIFLPGKKCYISYTVFFLVESARVSERFYPLDIVFWLQCLSLTHCCTHTCYFPYGGFLMRIKQSKVFFNLD